MTVLTFCHINEIIIWLIVQSVSFATGVAVFTGLL